MKNKIIGLVEIILGFNLIGLILYSFQYLDKFTNIFLVINGALIVVFLLTFSVYLIIRGINRTF